MVARTRLNVSLYVSCLSCLSCGDAGEHAQCSCQAAVQQKIAKIVICLKLGTINTSKRVAAWNIWKCRQQIEIKFTRKVKTGFCSGYTCCDSILTLLPLLLCVGIWRYNIYRTV